ncbi:CoA pyrophosphatase [Fluviicola sp. SGL-29]|nr:CoA pyrophosphatase [Fluviicola sp. SGL-29]
MTSEEFLTQIRTSFHHPLPGIEAHKLLTPGKRPLIREEVPDIEEYRASAVAIVCYPVDNNVHSILIQRPDYNGNHGGQISLPGGKAEPDDLTMEYTARRETEEEIGWKLSEEHYLGQLTELFIPVSKFSVQPFLYFCEGPQPFLPDAREVAKIIQFPVADLRRKSIVKTTTIRVSSGMNLKDVPYFDIDNHVVWGATAIILSEFRELLS